MNSFLLMNFWIHIIFCCTIVNELDVFNLSRRLLCNIYTSMVYGLPQLIYEDFRHCA